MAVKLFWPMMDQTHLLDSSINPAAEPRRGESEDLSCTRNNETPLIMHSQARSQNDRPNKRARPSDATSQRSWMNSDPHTTRQQGPGSSQKTRVAVACKVCRSRKTKCDSRWPVCSYCDRTNSDCQYDSIDSVDRPM